MTLQNRSPRSRRAGSHCVNLAAQRGHWRLRLLLCSVHRTGLLLRQVSPRPESGLTTATGQPASSSWPVGSLRCVDLKIRDIFRTSLVVQWLRIRLPMQGTRVWALVREDPTCCRATKPVRHNYWARALEPTCRNYWARVPQLLNPARSNEDPTQPKINK